MSPTLPRRQMLQTLTAAPLALTAAMTGVRPSLAGSQPSDADIGPLDQDVLPTGIRSRFVDGINGLRVHILEAGYERCGGPGVFLLHGFPELAYSWRHIMVPLSEAGYHVVAPDMRGYGRTTGWNNDYDTELSPWRRLNLVRDVLGLVNAFGYRSVQVVGHDFGSPMAAWCAVTRPDVFTAVALMSAPFGGTATLPFDTANNPAPADEPGPDLYAELARLPRPRKHYQRYYTTRSANENMWHAEQGLHAFLRAYYHHKSADWKENQPYRLAGRTASEMAKMPTYYIMDLGDGMAETVAKHMPTEAEINTNTWLPDDELAVYTQEYGRTGFQGGLNHYRSGALGAAEMQLFAGRPIDQPSLFISGASDWGSYQSPGALERMQEQACTNMRAVHMIDGAGHWVQQEQPQETASLLIEFLQNA